MRVGTFSDAEGAAFVGEIDADRVVRLEAPTMLAWLAGEGRRRTGPEYESAGLVTLAPVPEPPSVRDFYAFERHVAAGARLRGREIAPYWYQAPAFYFSNPASILGPGAPVRRPAAVGALDFELEIAAVVGLSASGGEPEIAGFTLMNDWSARDVQRDEMACGLGPAKAKDFATSLGPCVVTADELDPGDLWLTARVDGEIWSKGNLGASRWTFPQMIAHVSQDEEVWPGDVYGSGTFGGGCGLDLDRSLWPGAVVELEADRIGILRNTVAAA